MHLFGKNIKFLWLIAYQEMRKSEIKEIGIKTQESGGKIKQQ